MSYHIRLPVILGFVLLAPGATLFSQESASNDRARKTWLLDGPSLEDPALGHDPTVSRTRPVTIDLQELRAETAQSDVALRLNLFDDATFTAVVDRVEDGAVADQIMVGHVLGDETSSVTIVVSDRVVVGNIRVPSRGAYYQIRYLGQGVHVIRRIDESKFPPCGTGAEHNIQGAVGAPSAGGGGAASSACGDDGSLIDVLVVYTPAARAAAGGTTAMEALIDLSVSESNTSYDNSLINMQLRLVHAGEVNYDESVGMSTALGQLRDPADGILDEVHALRDQYRADMVALLTNGGGYCGIAYVMKTLSPDFEANAFSVTAWSCAAGNLTFPHELGHNMGCAHNREDAHTSGLYSYSYGYQDPNENFRTVMSYNCTNSCPRVRHFSNPDVYYQGMVTGNPLTDPQPTHNALTINESSPTIACFRNSDCNGNGIPDDVDIANGTSEDCSGNGIPDECEPDCNGNGAADSCDIFTGSSEDCDANRIPDDCETYRDCNGNSVHDPCDISGGISIDCNGNWIPDDCIGDEVDCNGNNIPDDCDITSGFSEDCNGNGIPDECDLATGASDCNNNSVPDECEIAEGVAADCNSNNIIDVCDIAGGTLVDQDGNGVPDACEAPILFVDTDATGLNYGTSWADAFVGLQDALGIAVQPLNAVTEVWVAEGTYIPTSGSDPNDPRSATFQLADGVAIYGGFVGGETDRDARDPAIHVTTLTADLWGDDGPDFTNQDDNAYHVVTGSGNDNTAILDGFTVTAGRADVASAGVRGGSGILIIAGSPSVTNCIIERNMANGHAMHSGSYSSPIVTDCVFRENQGGALSITENSDPLVRDCKFVGNSADHGAAIYNSGYMTAQILNCVFFRNSAAYSGGAIYNVMSTPTIANCIFSGNDAGGNGGAMFNTLNANPLTINSTFLRNTAARGGGIFVFRSAPRITNCILWDNQDDYGTGEQKQVYATEGDPIINNSCVKNWSGALGGAGNTGADPELVSAVGPDGIPGNDDDDLRLSGSSPCIDAGVNLLDAGPTDLDGSPRVVDMMGVPDTGAGIPPLVDMGAYEYHTDCNNNGTADEYDIASGTSDCNETGVPDECERGVSGFSGFAFVAVDATGPFSYNSTCNEIIVEAGAKLTLEMRISGWDPDLDGDPLLEGFQAAVDTAGFTGGLTGSVGFQQIPCTSDGDCPGFCDENGFCDLRSVLYVDLQHPDLVIPAYAGIFATSPALIAVGGVALNPNGWAEDTGVSKYIGTALLEASSDATGTFTIGFAGSDSSFLLDTTGTTIPTPDLIPLLVTIIPDCNLNGLDDRDELADGSSQDCNGNGFPDECDTRNGTSNDCDGNAVPDECQPDCNLDGIPDQCELGPNGPDTDCNGNTIPDACEIAAGSSTDCNTNGLPDECEPDCNINGVPDDCDLASSTSQDIDGNGVPDECDRAPQAAGYGCRALAITPVAGFDQVALHLTSPDHPCLSLYISETGGVTLEPVYRLPEEWGTVHVTSGIIVSASTYHINAETATSTSAPVAATTAIWGDTVGYFDGTQWTPPDGTVGIVDATAALDSFRHLSFSPPLEWCDTYPEVPDGKINITDVTFILNAFKGFPYPYSDPCP